MPLDPDTIRRLARMTLEARPDDVACADWIHRVGEYVEAQQRGQPLDERLQQVERHTRLCRVCAKELELLRALVEEEDAGEG